MQIWNTIVILATTLVFAEPQSEVTLIDGSQLAGEVTELSDDNLKFTSDGQTKALAIEQLQTINLSDANAEVPPNNKFAIQLHDGSTIHASNVLATATNARATIAEELSYRLKSDSISSIQFRQLTEEAQQDYNAILEADSAGDVLIVLRPSGAIDELEGIIERVDEQAVTFNFDGDRIPVELSKLAGIKLLKPGSLEVAKTICQIHDLQGNLWQARRLTWKSEENSLSFETGLGDSITLGLENIQQLRFASSNIAYLSDLQPERAEWTPYLTGRLIRNRLTQLYAPVKDRNANGGELIIGEQTFSKGLSLRSKTELVYRLTDEFNHLHLTAGLAEESKGRGHLELIILGDNRQLFKDFLTDPEDIRVLDLDITGVRRLSITVDYGKNLDIGDLLNLGDGKLIK